MKKLLFLITLFASSYAAHAQVSFKPGIRAGANFSSITNTASDVKADFYIGALGALKLSHFYTLQPEVTYSRQGTSQAILYQNSFDPSYNSPSSTYRIEDITLNYVGVAVMNKFGLKHFHFQVGPGIDILSSDSRYSNSTIDLTFNIGLGVDLSENFGIEGRFKKGMIDTIESYNFYDGYSSSNNTNSVFSIGAYFKFQ